MFLVPQTTDTPRLPATVTGAGGSASVSYLDDQPIFCTEHAARFAIKRRRRLPWTRTKIETIGQVTGFRPAPALKSGDTVELAIGDETMSWRYDSNANLGRAARVALATLKVGTVLAGLAVLERFASELSWNAYQSSTMASSARGGPISSQIRDNASRVYPDAENGPSEYVKGLAKAQSANEDLRAFSERWIAEHPKAPMPEVKP